MRWCSFECLKSRMFENRGLERRDGGAEGHLKGGIARGWGLTPGAILLEARRELIAPSFCVSALQGVLGENDTIRLTWIIRNW